MRITDPKRYESVFGKTVIAAEKAKSIISAELIRRASKALAADKKRLAIAQKVSDKKRTVKRLAERGTKVKPLDVESATQQ